LLNSIPLQFNHISDVIIVDQNCSDLIDDICDSFMKKLPIKHIKVSFKGAAKARNYGANFSKGDYICFPDDDSTFKSETIQIASQLILSKNLPVIFGKCVDENNNSSVINFSTSPSFLNFKNYHGKFVESTIFISKKVFTQYYFDEKMGVGTFHGAEEAHDLVLRLLKAKVEIFYDPRIIFFHPQKITNYSDQREILRVYNYRSGLGYLCKKHGLFFLFLNRFIKVFLYIFVLLIINRKKVRYYSAELLGLLTGLVI
jgi:glycosyltransferase involved in cell wall biosynthesis